MGRLVYFSKLDLPSEVNTITRRIGNKIIEVVLFPTSGGGLRIVNRKSLSCEIVADFSRTGSVRDKLEPWLIKNKISYEVV